METKGLIPGLSVPVNDEVVSVIRLVVGEIVPLAVNATTEAVLSPVLSRVDRILAIAEGAQALAPVLLDKVDRLIDLAEGAQKLVPVVLDKLERLVMLIEELKGPKRNW